MSNSLYRHFDANGKLLYVGASLYVLQRTCNHAASTPWFDEIVTIKIEKFESRELLLDAEKKAIKSESPLHNIRHSRRPARPRVPYVAPVPVIPFDEWPKAEKRRYLSLTEAQKKSIATDKHVENSVRHEWKLDINTVYFIKEGRRV